MAKCCEGRSILLIPFFLSIGSGQFSSSTSRCSGGRYSTNSPTFARKPVYMLYSFERCMSKKVWQKHPNMVAVAVVVPEATKKNFPPTLAPSFPASQSNTTRVCECVTPIKVSREVLHEPLFLPCEIYDRWWMG